VLKQDVAHKPIRFIQLTDTHLSLNSHTELLQVNTEDSFKAVVALLNKRSDIDLLLLTGDLSQDGSEAAYERIAQILKRLTMPIYCLPGNHDDATVM